MICESLNWNVFSVVDVESRIGREVCGRADVASLRIVIPLVAQRQGVLLPKLQIDPWRNIDVVVRICERTGFARGEIEYSPVLASSTAG